MIDNSERNLQHPVWNVYGQMRTSRLNALYYGSKHDFYERLQISMQVILAATVPSSAIAGFEIWDFGIGEYAWESLVALSSLIAFSQPFLSLQKKIKKLDELVIGYKILYFDLQDIRQKIEEDQIYSKSQKKAFQAAKDRRKKLEVKETGLWYNSRLNRKCQKLVSQELPAKNFFIPKEI